MAFLSYKINYPRIYKEVRTIQTIKERIMVIKAIIFDVGGVLQIPKTLVRLIQDTHLAGVPAHCGHRNKSIHEYLAGKLKIVLDQWLDAIDTAYVKSIEGKLTEKQVLKVISQNLKVNKYKLKKWLVHAYKRNFSLNKELKKQAIELKKQGYKIAILSDQWHFSKIALMPRSLIKHFSPVIVSCEVGVRKPNKEIYSLTLEKLKVMPSECLFIDNQEWNLRPAKKLGMKTILFKNNKQLFKEKKYKQLFKQPVQTP